MIFLFNTTSWIYPLKFISVYLKLPVVPILICHLQIYFLFHSNFLVLFCLVFIYLGAEASHSIYPCTIQPQYHVMAIGVFPLWLSGLGSSTGIFWNIFFIVSKYILDRSINPPPRLADKNQWNRWLHWVKIMLLLSNLMVTNYHHHCYHHQKIIDALFHAHQ